MCCKVLEHGPMHKDHFRLMTGAHLNNQKSLLFVTNKLIFTANNKI